MMRGLVVTLLTAFSLAFATSSTLAGESDAPGSPQRGRLGITIQPLTDALAEHFSLPKGQGVLVNAVDKGGAGERAGIIPGDVILAFDGRAIGDGTELARQVARTKPGAAVALTVWRNKAKHIIHARLGEVSKEVTATVEANDICSGLKQVIGDAARNFQALKASATPLLADQQPAYPAQNLLPGSVNCEVSERAFTIAYSCYRTRTDVSRAEARATFERDVALVRRCFPEIKEEKSSERVDWDVNGDITIRVRVIAAGRADNLPTDLNVSLVSVSKWKRRPQ